MSALPFDRQNFRRTDEIAAEIEFGREIERLPRTPRIEIEAGSESRRLAIYDPNSVFQLIDELSFLSKRAVEGNVFFDPRFLAPAMPRLDDRRVKLLAMRDEDARRSRLRLLMPFSVERYGLTRRFSAIRAWSHPFGPNGTLLLDGDDPQGTLESFLRTITRPELKLPDLLVLPNVRLDGPMVAALRETAARLGLPLQTVNDYDRAALVKHADIETGSRPPRTFSHLSAKRRRELKRQTRRLSFHGPVSLHVAREVAAVRPALEEFLAIEAKGWKGQTRSAMVMDRFRAAFAREAVDTLAEEGRVRIFSLKAGFQTIASLIVFVDRGEAYAWKTAYDERFAGVSPGQLLMSAATDELMADPSVRRADSCAVPDHFVMNRFWTDRIRIGTLVVGLTPGNKSRVEEAARKVAGDHRLRNRFRIARDGVKRVLRSGSAGRRP